MVQTLQARNVTLADLQKHFRLHLAAFDYVLSVFSGVDGGSSRGYGY